MSRRAVQKDSGSGGAPDWMVTYGDIMTLLLCFFVILVSMSEIKQDQKFQQVMESLRRAFGGYDGSVGAVPVENVSTNALIARLLELEIPINKKKKGDSDEEGIHGKKFRVTNVRDGLEVVIGGRGTDLTKRCRTESNRSMRITWCIASRRHWAAPSNVGHCRTVNSRS